MGIEEEKVHIVFLRGSCRLVFLLLFMISFIAVKSQGSLGISNELRLRVEQLGAIGLAIGGEKICCKATIQTFYQSGMFAPVWDDQSKKELIQAVRDSYEDGLNPEDYHLGLLLDYEGRQGLSSAELSNYELLLTDAFLLLTTHLMSGKVDPKTFDSEWKVLRREGNPLELFTEAMQEKTVLASLNDIKPKYKSYQRLKDKLRIYREIQAEGGWPIIEISQTLKLNMRGEAVSLLRERLIAVGDLPTLTNDELELFDEELEKGLKKYQKRHGLEQDGAVGKETLKSLNIPVEDRITDIRLNLERCRWLPNQLGGHYVMINLPAYDMEVVKNGEVKLEMDVAVGKPYRQTPVFSANLIYLVLNPYWTVPPTILYQDIIPAQIKNPNYIQNLKIKVINDSGAEIAPGSIDWSSIQANKFPYMLRQEPGSNNALGVVKFIFPNPYNIYMHDTNHREIFVKSDRALSSGCVRLSRPLDFAYYLLGQQSPALDQPKVDDLIKSASNKSISVQPPLQVHLQYWTSFVDENGLLNFRKDIYGRNAKLRLALFEKSTAP